jgi:nickel-dependent lactate racemase
MDLELHFGSTGIVHVAIDDSRMSLWRPGPSACADPAAAARTACESPLDSPPLERIVVPGDTVALVVDRHTPAAATLVAEVVRRLMSAGVEPGSITTLQPAAMDSHPLSDPRVALPEEIRGVVHRVRHDATDPRGVAYLASTALGERLYLARCLVEADVVIAIGELAFDPILGCRGTNSALYPGLSNTDAIRKSHGQGHDELSPTDIRPMRQLVDEVGWLLGSMFTVQTIASTGIGCAAVLAGSPDAVMKSGSAKLVDLWGLSLPERVPVVAVSVDADAAGHGWRQITAALDVARQMVIRGGKIVVFSDFSEELDAGMRLLQGVVEARNALPAIRKLSPPDLLTATQLAAAVDWANVYLLSRMDPNTVDDLFMMPLDAAKEGARLITQAERVAVIQSAQHAWPTIG